MSVLLLENHEMEMLRVEPSFELSIFNETMKLFKNIYTLTKTINAYANQ